MSFLQFSSSCWVKPTPCTTTLRVCSGPFFTWKLQAEICCRAVSIGGNGLQGTRADLGDRGISAATADRREATLERPWRGEVMGNRTLLVAIYGIVYRLMGTIGPSTAGGLASWLFQRNLGWFWLLFNRTLACLRCFSIYISLILLKRQGTGGKQIDRGSWSHVSLRTLLRSTAGVRFFTSEPSCPKG